MFEDTAGRLYEGGTKSLTQSGVTCQLILAMAISIRNKRVEAAHLRNVVNLRITITGLSALHALTDPTRMIGFKAATARQLIISRICQTQTLLVRRLKFFGFDRPVAALKTPRLPRVLDRGLILFCDATISLLWCVPAGKRII